MNEKEPTNYEILQAINSYATHNDQRWQKNEERLTRMEALMVTKDYLDEKLADLRGDLVILMRIPQLSL